MPVLVDLLKHAGPAMDDLGVSASYYSKQVIIGPLYAEKRYQEVLLYVIKIVFPASLFMTTKKFHKVTKVTSENKKWKNIKLQSGGGRDAKKGKHFPCVHILN